MSLPQPPHAAPIHNISMHNNAMHSNVPIHRASPTISARTHPPPHHVQVRPANPNRSPNSHQGAPKHPPKKPDQRVNSARLSEVMEDLCIRFIVNLPSEEFESFERLFFAIESAHWFYDDFYREQDSTLPRLPLKQFTSRLFEHTALLSHYRDHVDHLVSQFQTYKKAVPTCGAALLNAAMDKIVLVRGWGRDGRWGFPKGKLAKDETEIECAIREVEEETGFDMSPHIDHSTYCIESFLGDRYMRIFVVPAIPETAHFETHTRKEISDIMWIPIHLLPDSARGAKAAKHGLAAREEILDSKGQRVLFAQYTFATFTKRLKAYIKRERKRLKTSSPHPPPSPPDVAAPKPANADSERIPTLEEAYSAAEAEATILAEQHRQRHNRANTAETTPSKKPVATPARSHGTSKESNNTHGAGEMRAVGASRTGGNGSGGANGNGSGGGKGSGRKSRKVEGRHEAVRNRATFGSQDSAALSRNERSNLFLKYLMETDRIKAERGLEEEFWPVPYITSENFTAEQRRDASAAFEERRLAAAAAYAQNGHAGNGDDVVANRGEGNAISAAAHEEFSCTMDLFAFDRAAIMEKMRMEDPS